MAAIQRDDAANRLQVALDFFDDRIKIGADEQKLGAGVLDDESRFGRSKAEIDRDQNRVRFCSAEP